MDTKNLKVFVTRPIPEPGLKLLEQHFNLKVRQDETAISKEELIEEIKDCSAILTILSDKMDGSIMDLAPNLKIVSNFAVGYDNINVPDATARGIKVGNTPDVLTQSTAEHALALTVALAKRVPEGDRVMRENAFPGWGPMYMLGTELYQKTVGILGYGRIGKRYAAMMKAAFDCKIIFVDNCSPDTDDKDDIGTRVTLDELVEQSDILSVHVPLCGETKHLINKERLRKMKKTALLINTARGPVVDEQALLEELQNKTIGGAAMDVFEAEPRRLEGLEKCENVVMTPHTASATWEARNLMSEIAAKNIIGVLVEGETPVSIVNK